MNTQLTNLSQREVELGDQTCQLKISESTISDVYNHQVVNLQSCHHISSDICEETTSIVTANWTFLTSLPAVDGIEFVCQIQLCPLNSLESYHEQ